MNRIAIGILGSTGSIGASTLRVVDRFPDRLRVVALAAGSNADRLARQALHYRPEVVALADESKADRLRFLLKDFEGTVIVGSRAIMETASWPSVATLVVAVVGFSGLHPTLAAIDAGKNIALANKETLVAAGSIVMRRAGERGVTIAPIDSEHSAVWQCLRAGRTSEVKRLVLTASGGPFRERPYDTFASITPAEALAHPTWRMGPRITIDSATLMNKGFEIIEAAWLFGIEPARIDIVVHPQSVVHSMVEFVDGSTLAQLGPPDMTLPIAYALFAPERPPASPGAPAVNPVEPGALEFFAPDPVRFPAPELARKAFRLGGTAPAILNAADEAAVSAFLDNRIPFPAIVELIDAALAAHEVVSDAGIDDITGADRWARMFVNERVKKMYTDSEMARDAAGCNRSHESRGGESGF